MIKEKSLDFLRAFASLRQKIATKVLRRKEITLNILKSVKEILYLAGNYFPFCL